VSATTTSAPADGKKLNVVQLLVSKIVELQKMMLNQKIRKPFDYNRHGKKDFQAVLEPGDIIALEPFEQYTTHFMVRNDSVPELLPAKEIDLVTTNANALPIYDQSANIITRDITLDTLDLSSMQLGVYYFVVLDPMIFVQFSQPSPVKRFLDKTNPINFTQKNTLNAFRNKDYGRLPQLAVFADTTTIKASVGSYDPNRTRRHARLLAFGFKYELDAAKVNDNLDRNDPRVVTTFFTGTRTRS
jgi:hypothetical protein